MLFGRVVIHDLGSFFLQDVVSIRNLVTGDGPILCYNF